MPEGRPALDTFGLRLGFRLDAREPREFHLDHIAARNPAEAGLHDTVAVEDEGRRGLQHVEVLRDIGTIGQIDIEMADTGASVRNGGERAVNARASGAHLGTELQECRDIAQAVGAEPGGLDDLMGHVVMRASLVPPDDETRDDGDRQQDGQSDQGFNESHSNPG